MATINQMFKTLAKPTAHATISWFITGLLLTGCFVSLVAIDKASVVCAEERIVEAEIDDERSDFNGIDFALFVQVDLRPASQTWSDIQVFFCEQLSQVEFSANSERGPPSC